MKLQQETIMKRFARITAALLAVILCCSTLAGCGNTQSDETLKFGCINYSDSLDPSTMTNAAWSGGVVMEA